jgi:hypothetical protein
MKSFRWWRVGVFLAATAGVLAIAVSAALASQAIFTCDGTGSTYECHWGYNYVSDEGTLNTPGYTPYTYWNYIYFDKTNDQGLLEVAWQHTDGSECDYGVGPGPVTFPNDTPGDFGCGGYLRWAHYQPYGTSYLYEKVHM